MEIGDKIIMMKLEGVFELFIKDTFNYVDFFNALANDSEKILKDLLDRDMFFTYGNFGIQSSEDVFEAYDYLCVGG